MPRSQQKPLTLTRAAAQAVGMAGIPFRSVLQPHLDFVRARRRAGDTWRAIAETLQKRGVPASASNVCEVYRRASKRTKWPAGLEPEAQAAPAADPILTTGASTKPAGIFGGVKQSEKAPVSAPTSEAHEPGPPKPFRSQMLAHLPFIRAQRAAKQSWRQIATDLAARGVRVSYQAVASFYERTQAREKRREEENAPHPTASPTSAPAQAEPDPFAGTDELDTFRLPKSDRRK